MNFVRFFLVVLGLGFLSLNGQAMLTDSSKEVSNQGKQRQVAILVLPDYMKCLRQGGTPKDCFKQVYLSKGELRSPRAWGQQQAIFLPHSLYKCLFIDKKSWDECYTPSKTIEIPESSNIDVVDLNETSTSNQESAL